MYTKKPLSSLAKGTLCYTILDNLHFIRRILDFSICWFLEMYLFYSVQLPSKFQSLQLYISAALSPHQISVFVEWPVVNTDAHTSQSAESVSGVIIHKWGIYIAHLPSGSDTIMEEGAEIL